MKLKTVLSALLLAVACAPTLAADSVSFHLDKKISVPGDGGWDYLTFDGPSHRLFISRGTRVQVVDVESGSVVGEVANTPGVHGIAFARQLGHGFTSNGGESTVTVFDMKDLKEIARVKVGNHPDAIIYDPGSKRVFTMNAGSQDATAIDVATNTVVGTVPLGGKPEFAAADGQGHVYINMEDKSTIVQVDSNTLKVLNTWPLAPGEGPSGLAIDRRNHRLFSVCDNKKMVVMDSESGKIVATPTIGDGPDAAGYDGRAKLAFSSNGEGTLTVVREKSLDEFEVAATIKTERGARTMALDGRSHTVYLVTAKFGAADPNNPRRRSIEPGSFVVLVYKMDGAPAGN
jgi:YVTN family beta-propeller protein